MLTGFAEEHDTWRIKGVQKLLGSEVLRLSWEFKSSNQLYQCVRQLALTCLLCSGGEGACLWSDLWVVPHIRDPPWIFFPSPKYKMFSQKTGILRFCLWSNNRKNYRALPLRVCIHSVSFIFILFNNIFTQNLNYLMNCLRLEQQDSSLFRIWNYLKRFKV